MALDFQIPRTSDEMVQARAHWLALKFADSPKELKAAQQALTLSSPRVQNAILTAFLE